MLRGGPARATPRSGLRRIKAIAEATGQVAGMRILIAEDDYPLGQALTDGLRHLG